MPTVWRPTLVGFKEVVFQDWYVGVCSFSPRVAVLCCVLGDTGTAADPGRISG